MLEVLNQTWKSIKEYVVTHGDLGWVGWAFEKRFG
jgi:hypothetical protein